jgi:glutamate/tyrosine decarboxylase-like PLP-dependent enzyme
VPCAIVHVADDEDASTAHSGGMSARPELYTEALERAWKHARDWLADVPGRRVPPRTTADDLAGVLGGPLPDQPSDPGTVVDLLVAGVEPGLMAMPSGRFFGWVIGGTLPAALGADWLTSAWDQNAGMRYASPGVAAAEEAAGAWLLDLLGLPPGAAVGFTTGATMAGFTGLASARQQVLARAGWDVERLGLAGGPKVDVLVGAERHDSVDLALRYLGLGAPTPVAADDQGRIVPAALAEALAAVEGPAIVVLQAGNLHSGAYDPFRECIALAHDRGAWVHVDGAFGLWAAASPALRHLVDGVEAADSWATDAHKTLNAPYDCGVSVVAHPQPLQAAMSVRTSYLLRASDVPDPFDKVPEMSRRARGVPVWAALRSLGRTGVASLVDRLAANARAIADGIATVPGAEVLNEVVFTQVCVSFGDDARTRAVIERLLADGTAWMSGSRWHGRDVLRVSVSNWSTDQGDVDVAVDAVRRAALPL